MEVIDVLVGTVLSPGRFLLVRDMPGDHPWAVSLRSLERGLQERGSVESNPVGRGLPVKVGDVLGVRHGPSDWSRGSVMKTLDETSYMFLIDHGKLVNVKSTRDYLIPLKEEEVPDYGGLPPQAFEFSLLGLQPLDIELLLVPRPRRSVPRPCRLAPSENWNEQAKLVVAGLVEAADGVSARMEVIDDLPGLYGDLTFYLRTKSKKFLNLVHKFSRYFDNLTKEEGERIDICLSKFLIDCEFCRYVGEEVHRRQDRQEFWTSGSVPCPQFAAVAPIEPAARRVKSKKVRKHSGSPERQTAILVQRYADDVKQELIETLENIKDKSDRSAVGTTSLLPVSMGRGRGRKIKKVEEKRPGDSNIQLGAHEISSQPVGFVLPRASPPPKVSSSKLSGTSGESSDDLCRAKRGQDATEPTSYEDKMKWLKGKSRMKESPEISSKKTESVTGSDYKIQKSRTEEKRLGPVELLKNRMKLTKGFKEKELTPTEPSHEVLGEGHSVLTSPENRPTRHDTVKYQPSTRLRRRKKSALLLSERGVICEHDANARKIPAVRNLEEIMKYLHGDLIAFLTDSRVDQLKRLQSVMWPSLCMGRSFVGVAPEEGGKTLGFLIPVINAILKNNCSNVDESPMALVVCPTWKKAVEVSEQIHLITEKISAEVPGSNRKLKGLLIFEREEKMAAQLMNGCHILVSTPQSTIRLLSLSLTHLGRCSHLVFDDAQDIFESYAYEVVKIMDAYKKQREIGQVIVTANSWSKWVKQFAEMLVKEMEKNNRMLPTIGIANGLDAAIFGRVEVKPQFFQTEEEKLFALGPILEENQGQGRNVLIFCSDKSKAEMVQDYIVHSLGKTCHAIWENLPNGHLDVRLLLERIQKDCTNSGVEMVPVILTDKAPINEWHLLNSPETIVHYDYPSVSKKIFANRHFLLRHTFCRFYEKEEDSFLRGRSHLLLCPSDHQTMTSTLMFLREIDDCKIPTEIEAFMIGRFVQIAKSKRGARICTNLKTIGNCKTLIKCKQRHFFDGDFDVQSAIVTMNSLVYFRVVTLCEEPVRFLASIENVERGTWKRSKALSQKLFCLKVENLQKVSELPCLDVGGKLYLTRGTDRCLKRVEILDKMTDQHGDSTLTVLDVDEGVLVERLKNPSIWELPDELGEFIYPRQAAEIIILGLKPKDRDLEWSHRIREFCQTHLLPAKENGLDHDSPVFGDQESDKKPLFRATAVLVVGSSIWVHKVEKIDRLQTMKNSWTCVEEIRSSILRKSLADENPEHLEQLKNLCSNAGIQTEQEQSLSSAPDIPTSAFGGASSYRWAFLEEGRRDQWVTVTEVFSPGHFYVRRCQFEANLMDLERDLIKHVEDKFGTLTSATVGKVYAGNLSEDNDGEPWFPRVLVNEMKGESYAVTLVDYGQQRQLKLSELAPIRQTSLIDRLPFQGIECRLFGIRPPHYLSGWSARAGNFLYDFCVESDDTVALCALRTAGGKQISEITGNPIYEISLERHSASEKSMKTAEFELVRERLAEPDGADVIDFSKFEVGGGEVQRQEEERAKAESKVPSEKVVQTKSKESEARQNAAPAEAVANKVRNCQAEDKFNGVKLCPARVSAPEEDLPALATVTGVTSLDEEKLPASVEWSQSASDFIGVRIKFDLRFDLDPRFVFVSISCDSIIVQYLELVTEKGSEEENSRREFYSLHQLPNSGQVHLFGKVDPQKSIVEFTHTGVNLKLWKVVHRHFWKGLIIDPNTKHKVVYSWLKQNLEPLFDGDDAASSDDGEDISKKKKAKKAKKSRLREEAAALTEFAPVNGTGKEPGPYASVPPDIASDCSSSASLETSEGSCGAEDAWKNSL